MAHVSAIFFCFAARQYVMFPHSLFKLLICLLFFFNHNFRFYF